jgi:methylmalonyl-CoA/ethylmalonyl-CoA epimerase
MLEVSPTTNESAQMTKPEIKLGRIKQIALVQKDVARAVPFYKDGLGLTLLFEVAGMAFFDAGGVRLMLTKPSAPEFDHPNSILYFDVPDIHAAYAQCKARGVTFDEEPHAVGKTATHEVWICACRDPEKNVIELMEERKL